MNKYKDTSPPPYEEKGHFNPTFVNDQGKTAVAIPTEEEEEEDPWKVSKVIVEQVPFKDLDGFGKIKRIAGYLIRTILVLTCLYFFICSLDFLSSAFKLLGGRKAGEVFQQSDILTNPIAGLMMGVLVTVLVQSSSTSTSIVISMVGAGILTIRTAIPIVMGANIGTSVTNTIVALGQITDKNEFRRAFAGATVHDMFNWLTVLIFLPLEIITGYLFYLSKVIIDSLPWETNKDAKKDLLKVITKPFTTLIIQVDSKAINKIATADKSSDEVELMKDCCDKTKPVACCDSEIHDISWYKDSTFTNYTDQQKAELCTVMGTACVTDKNLNLNFTSACQDSWHFDNITDANGTNTGDITEILDCSQWTKNQDLTCYKPCEYLFRPLKDQISEEAIGAILLVVALAILCICLICIVKLLNQLLKGQMALIIKKFINANFPGYCSYFTGYLAILIGAGLTILVQSSSIFTSSMTPLVGMGVIELDRMYPLTLGANIGTTTTGILSALAQDSETIKDSLQVAFCHLFFNISGILIFYPFPFFRPPIPLAKFLGNVTADYRWFAILYIFLMFLVLPALVFGLSIPGWYVLLGVLGPIALILIIIAIIKCIQAKRPSCLPAVLQDWHFLPKPLRSLEPYDRVLCGCLKKKDEDLDFGKSNGNVMADVPPSYQSTQM